MLYEVITLRASYYVDELLAPNSVNTAPIPTIEAFVKAQQRNAKLPLDPEMIEKHFADVADAGIDLEAVMTQLMQRNNFV